MIKGKDKIRLAEALAFFNPIEMDQSQNYVSFKLKSQSSFISLFIFPMCSYVLRSHCDFSTP